MPLAWRHGPREAVQSCEVKTAGDHPVSFYSDDRILATTVATFLAPAFAARQAIIAIGTPEHLSAIEDRLRASGHEIDSARASGQYASFDAQWALDQLTVHGLPTAERFHVVLGTHIPPAAAEDG